MATKIRRLAIRPQRIHDAVKNCHVARVGAPMMVHLAPCRVKSDPRTQPRPGQLLSRDYLSALGILLVSAKNILHHVRILAIQKTDTEEPSA